MADNATTSFADRALADAPTDYAQLREWVAQIAELTQPDSVQWVDGSEEERDRLADELVAAGTLTRLAEDKFPNSFAAFSDPADVARVEDRTFICSEKEEDAGPTNNWYDPAEMKKILHDAFTGAMRGRTMYVIPFVMGHLDAEDPKYGVEITDSAYVVCSMRIMAILSGATCVIAEGEVLQLTNIGNPSISEADYFETIQGKTAMLFEAASHSGAVLADATPEQERALQYYGRYLGLAFQLIDDLLDYQGDADAMGKNVGDDLAEGKPTLPLIHAMERGTPEQAKLIRQVIRKGGLEQLDEVLEIIHATGALTYTRDRAVEMADKALAELNALPESPFRDSMAQLARLAVERQA